MLRINAKYLNIYERKRRDIMVRITNAKYLNIYDYHFDSFLCFLS